MILYSLHSPSPLDVQSFSSPVTSMAIWSNCHSWTAPEASAGAAFGGLVSGLVVLTGAAEVRLLGPAVALAHQLTERSGRAARVSGQRLPTLTTVAESVAYPTPHGQYRAGRFLALFACGRWCGLEQSTAVQSIRAAGSGAGKGVVGGIVRREVGEYTAHIDLVWQLSGWAVAEGCFMGWGWGQWTGCGDGCG